MQPDRSVGVTSSWLRVFLLGDPFPRAPQALLIRRGRKAGNRADATPFVRRTSPIAAGP